MKPQYYFDSFVTIITIRGFKLYHHSIIYFYVAIITSLFDFQTAFIYYLNPNPHLTLLHLQISHT